MAKRKKTRKARGWDPQACRVVMAEGSWTVAGLYREAVGKYKDYPSYKTFWAWLRSEKGPRKQWIGPISRALGVPVSRLTKAG